MSASARPWWQPKEGRLQFWPEQGEFVRLAEAPCPALEPMVGWTFQVVRRQRVGLTVRLRASYTHTPRACVELVFSEPGITSLFEAA